jgi:hypothetical protein
MELDKFRPRRALRILANQPKRDEAPFLRTWALAQLLAWAILDQRPGKRRPKEVRDRADESKRRRKIRTRDAKQAGQITLAYLLDRHVSDRISSEEYKEKLELMLGLFMGCGGFSSCFKGGGADGLLYDVKRANRHLGYVYRIVDFMCRYKKHSRAAKNDPNFTIESAKSLIAQWAHEGVATYKVSKIGRIWERYRKAAPYIFAVYRFISFRSKIRNQRMKL